MCFDVCVNTLNEESFAGLNMYNFKIYTLWCIGWERLCSMPIIISNIVLFWCAYCVVILCHIRMHLIYSSYFTMLLILLH